MTIDEIAKEAAGNVQAEAVTGWEFGFDADKATPIIKAAIDKAAPGIRAETTREIERSVRRTAERMRIPTNRTTLVAFADGLHVRADAEEAKAKGMT